MVTIVPAHLGEARPALRGGNGRTTGCRGPTTHLLDRKTLLL